ncbi:MAG TPA: amino acid ABC transporter permease [Dictyobacter sp.]|jgi:His/Glu/Gln/Arg/opine family amino acid ABC transporter permease subunit|nr:amino acid ABC transporter permease [Dictyobacter sp.]
MLAGPSTRETSVRLGQGLWPRRAGSDYFYYVLVVVALGAFAYYLYQYRQEGLVYLPALLQGALVSLVVSLISTLFALLFGLMGALGRLSRFRLIRWLSTIYVEVVRGTPLLVQLLLWYYGIGQVLAVAGFNPHSIAFEFMTVLQNNSLVPDAFNGFFYGIIGLSFNYGAYMTEVFRAGILAVDKGQTEASLSLGLDARQTMRHVVLPQAIRIIIPPFTNNFITLIQDSAFLSVMAVIELEYVTIGFALPQTNPNSKLFVFVLGALCYLVICYPLSVLARYFERRLSVEHLDV